MQGNRSKSKRTMGGRAPGSALATTGGIRSRRMMRSPMGSRAKPPTVRLRRLAAELRRLRADAGYSREQVEEQTGVNEGTLYRLETARARPQRRTLIALLDLYRVEAPLRDDLIDIARSADGQGWAPPHHWQLPGEYAAYISFEAEARVVHNYESLFIPGLLQAAEHGRPMLPRVLPTRRAVHVDEALQT